MYGCVIRFDEENLYKCLWKMKIIYDSLDKILYINLYLHINKFIYIKKQTKNVF